MVLGHGVPPGHHRPINDRSDEGSMLMARRSTLLPSVEPAICGACAALRMTVVAKRTAVRKNGGL